ncbi:MAG: 30S ribosomal protein S17 [Patescibacteria group bacterium]
MSLESEKKSMKRKFSGEVVSAKMAKTIVVRVDRFKLHPRYQKRYRVSKKYKVHDPKGQYQVGNTVEFVQCRPLSKDKKFRVIYK